MQYLLCRHSCWPELRASRDSPKVAGRQRSIITVKNFPIEERCYSALEYSKANLYGKTESLATYQLRRTEPCAAYEMRLMCVRLPQSKYRLPWEHTSLATLRETAASTEIRKARQSPILLA